MKTICFVWSFLQRSTSLIFYFCSIMRLYNDLRYFGSGHLRRRIFISTFTIILQSKWKLFQLKQLFLCHPERVSYSNIYVGTRNVVVCLTILPPKTSIFRGWLKHPIENTFPRAFNAFSVDQYLILECRATSLLISLSLSLSFIFPFPHQHAHRSFPHS